MEEILVSVIMTVYNHEPYLKQAIEGVLMQKTDFRYELLIGEDCSTDKSREIVREYQKKYPDIVRPFYWKRNVGVQKNSYTMQSRATGRYIALCEGDDYWIDENKLQKQIEFLEKEPQYSGVYHNVDCVDEKGRKCKRPIINKYPHKEQETYTFDMIKGMQLVGQAGSAVYRNIYKCLDSKKISLFENCRSNGDVKLCLLLTCIGNIYLMEEVMACHRVVLKKGDSWSAKSYGKNMCFVYYQAYMERLKFAKEAFERNYRSANFEKSLLRQSLCYAIHEHTWSDVWICIKVFGLYLLNRSKVLIE